MTTIPTPNRGQPIDSNYLYQIVETVNGLSKTVSTQVANSSIHYDSGSGVNQSVGTANLKVDAGYVNVTKTVKMEDINSEETIPITFSSVFKYPPIVVLTPFPVDASDASKDVTAIITSVSTSGATGILKFKTKGNASVGVNFIAIGTPPQ